MFLRTLLMTLLAVALLHAGAQAQLVVGTDDTPATIFHIDVNTSAATTLLTGPDADTWAMAYDEGSNTLYWSSGSALFSSPFDMAGLTPTNLGDIMFNNATLVIVGLAFRDGKLLATRNISTEAVYEIDPVTLEATQLYVYPSAFDFGGCAVDATNGLFYGVSDATGGGQGRGLYEIDTGAGTTTFKAGYPAGETDIDGLAAHDGVAYYVIDQPGLFYVYDIASGMQTGTLDSPFTGSAIFSGAAWVSDGATSVEPSTWGGIKNMFR